MSTPRSLAEFLGVVNPGAPTAGADSQAPRADDVITDPADFCQRVLSSQEFRQYILNGITLGDLAPAVVCRLIDHGWGKPVDHLEVKDTTRKLEDLSVEDLEQRATKLAELARLIRLSNDGQQEAVH